MIGPLLSKAAMSDSLSDLILQHLRAPNYRPLRRRALAQLLEVADDAERYSEFKQTLRRLDAEGKITLTDRGAYQLPLERAATVPGRVTARRDEFTGTYRHNKRGFGFVVPRTDPDHPADAVDLFIPPGFNGTAINGDVVRAKVTDSGYRDGRPSLT